MRGGIRSSSVVRVDAALEHGVDHDRRPAARVPEADVAERVAGEVQHLDPPVVAEPDRLAAPQPLVDRRVAAAHRLQLGATFLVGLVEPVRLVPEVVLRHHRVVRLDPAPVELVAGEARAGVEVAERTVPARVVEVGVADQDVVDRLEPEPDRFQIRRQAPPPACTACRCRTAACGRRRRARTAP